MQLVRGAGFTTFGNAVSVCGIKAAALSHPFNNQAADVVTCLLSIARHLYMFVVFLTLADGLLLQQLNKVPQLGLAWNLLRGATLRGGGLQITELDRPRG